MEGEEEGEEFETSGSTSPHSLVTVSASVFNKAQCSIPPPTCNPATFGDSPD